MRPSLVLMCFFSAWMPCMVSDEGADEMEKKAAVDCKTIKKTNTRTMNFTERGKEYVCKQLVEKEHKLFTFFKVPELDVDVEPPIGNHISCKNGEVMIGGKRCFVVNLEPNAEDAKGNSLLGNNNCTRLQMASDKKQEENECHKYSTHRSPAFKINDKNLKKYRNLQSNPVNKKNVRGMIPSTKTPDSFKLSFPEWFKIPLGSQDVVFRSSSLANYLDKPHDASSKVHLEKRIVCKNKTNKNVLAPSKKLNLNVTPQVRSFPLKFIENIPTKIELTSVSLATAEPSTVFAVGALNKISLSYDGLDENGTENLDYLYPDPIERRVTSAVKHGEDSMAYSSDTTVLYDDSLDQLVSLSQ